MFISSTGSEAMFADLGHFSVRAIKVCETSNTFLFEE
jgi:K+ transporter